MRPGLRMKVVLEKLLTCPSKLNPSLFQKTISVVAARLPAKSLASIKNTLPKNAWLDIPRIKPIALDPKMDPQVRLLLLDYQEELAIPELVKSKLSEANVIEYINHAVSLDYEYWTADDILHASLPDGIIVPSGFEIVGHIAHLNLQDDHQPYKSFIGQVILDKNKSIRTVVAKVGTIDSKFRFFEMDLLAGEPDFLVTVKQGDCRFRFDYSRVYWNSRLQHEHDRLVKEFIKPGDLVFDVFAGVGPFAIPASRAGAIVHANDLNPHSHQALLDNCKLNKAVNVMPYCLDGRDFIMKSEEIAKNGTATRRHYIMNLPALAPEFCDAFAELAWPPGNPHLIHCYMFCRPGEGRVEKIALPVEGVQVVGEHLVRSVAPNKDMYCVSFKWSTFSSKRPRL